MRYDGLLAPNTIIIQLPLSVLERLSNAYEQIGRPSGQARYDALWSIRQRIQQYLPAGTPYVLLDEALDYWPSNTADMTHTGDTT